MSLVELPSFIQVLERVYLRAGTRLELDYAIVDGEIELGVVVRAVGNSLLERYYGSVEGVRTASLQVRVQRELSRLFGCPIPFVVPGLLFAYARIIREAKAVVDQRVMTRVPVCCHRSH